MAYFVEAVFLLSALVALTTCISYSKLPGQFVDISAKGDELWALDRSRNVFRFDFDNEKWNQIPASAADGVKYGQPNTIGASPDGWTWITTNGGTSNIFRYNPDAKKWEGPMNGEGNWLVQINAASKQLSFGQGGGDKMWITNYPSPAVISDNLAVLWGACGEEGDECWLIEKGTKKVWSTTLNDKTGKTNSWVQMPGVSPSRDPATMWVKGVAETVDVQSPSRGVMTTTGGQVYMWNGDRWNKLAVENAAKATIGRSRIFILDQTENVVMTEK